MVAKQSCFESRTGEAHCNRSRKQRGALHCFHRQYLPYIEVNCEHSVPALLNDTLGQLQ